MNQLSRAFKLSSAARLWGALGALCFSTSAMAQSAGAFATSPYVPFMPSTKLATEACACPAVKPVAVPGINAKPLKPEPKTASIAGQILPIVMFRGKPPAPLSRPAVVSMVPAAIALPAEPPRQPAPVTVASAPAQVDVPVLRVAAQPAVKAKADKPAGPFKRIWRDTKKSVVQDIPDALADALPWVDRGYKDEPIEQVLARVSADLSRASTKDPEWINPAESELRQLSKRLATLAEPPVSGTSSAAVASIPEQDAASRPFRPRPIWPGASGRPEMQSRPTALVTGSAIQQGPEAIGQRLPPPTDWVEEEEEAPKPSAQQVVAKRSKRP
jgi:hypothetical protein